MSKYKVGDKVRVRSDLVYGARYGQVFCNEQMTELIGKELTIEGHSYSDLLNTERYYVKENCWTWTKEMFEGLAEEHHMTAEEVLEWLKDNYEGGNYTKCFGNNYTMANLLSVGLLDNKYSNLSSSEIVSKIEEYERNKKQEEEKEIETEFRYVLRIIEDKDGVKKCVDEKIEGTPFDVSQTILNEYMINYLKEYCRTHKGNFFCSLERNCYVKKGE